MKTVLTIAGTDPSGGAGIQADLKTMTAHKVYGMSVITALVAQNTTGVTSVLDIPPAFVEQQMDCVFTDIFPDAVKIGMVSSVEIIRAIARKLKEYGARNIVADPVMVSTSRDKLLNDDAVHTLVHELLPLADIITPNIYEAEVLCGLRIENKEHMLEAAKRIAADTGVKVLVKGGHLETCADDLLYVDGQVHWYEGVRLTNPNTHGTGCTLSSAIASALAVGQPLEEAIRSAKRYITGALAANLDLGKGRGPLNHCHNIEIKQ